jgi:HK97 gp10 family phage protein
LRTIQVKGLEQATAALLAVGKAVDSPEVMDILLEGAQTFRNAAYINAPIGTGATRRSLIAKAGKVRKGFASALAAVDFKLIPGGGEKRMQRYPYIVEYGARPHIIRGKAGKRLAFEADGELRVVGSVQHPGIRPQFFFRDAVSMNRSKVQKRVEQRLAEMIDKLGTPA